VDKAVAFNAIVTAINARVMRYATKLYIHIGIWFTAGAVLADQWLRHSGAAFVLGFGVIYSVMMIIVGRWLFGRKTL